MEYEAFIYNHPNGDMLVNVIPIDTTHHGLDECFCNPRIEKKTQVGSFKTFTQTTVIHKDIYE